MTANDPTPDFDASGNGRLNSTLVAVSVYSVAVSVVLLGMSGLPTAVRLPLALPLLLFAPGYAVVTAAFPTVRNSTDDPSPDTLFNRERQQAGFSTLERWVIAVVASIAIVPLVTLAVNAVVGVRAGSVVASLAALTVVASSIGLRRSNESQASAGGAPNAGTPAFDVSRLRGATRGARPVAIALVLLLLASSAALSIPGSEETPARTEFYLANDSVNGSGPSTDANAAYHLRIAQYSDDSQRYTVVVTADGNGDETPSWEELDRFSTEVPSGGTGEETYRVSTAEIRSNSTLRFLLYRGDAPARPGPDSAHRTLRVSVDATTDST